jgi:hypothetical protein
VSYLFIGTEAVQFLFWEYINGIFIAAYYMRMLKGPSLVAPPIPTLPTVYLDKPQPATHREKRARVAREADILAILADGRQEGELEPMPTLE